MKKVLFLTNIPAPYRVDFFNELGKFCDLTVTFEGTKATDRDKKWRADAAKNYRPVLLRGVRCRSDAFFCPGVLSVLRQKWDAIIIGTYATPTSALAIEYLRARRIPFLLSADGGFIGSDAAWKYRLKRRLISSASAWLSSGEATTAYLTHYGAQEDRCFLYPFTSLTQRDLAQGRAAAQAEKTAMREQLGVTEKTVLLSVGQFIPRKGLDLLIRSAAALPKNVGVYIVGGEPTEEYLTLRAQCGADNVRFVGFRTKPELARWYAAADVFVLPTREDIWGLVINEALSYGLPVVTTTRCIAGLELIEDGKNGYLVPVDDVDALTDAIRRAAEASPSMRSATLAAAAPYSIEAMAQTHLRILAQLDARQGGSV